MRYGRATKSGGLGSIHSRVVPENRIFCLFNLMFGEILWVYGKGLRAALPLTRCGPHAMQESARSDNCIYNGFMLRCQQ